MTTCSIWLQSLLIGVPAKVAMAGANLPKDPFVTLRNIEARYQALQSYDAVVVHHLDLYASQGDYKEKLHWSRPSGIHLESSEIPKESEFKPGKLYNDGFAIHVDDENHYVSNFSNSSFLHFDKMGGPILQWLMRSKPAFLGSRPKVKATWGSVKLWYGQKVRAIILTTKAPQMDYANDPEPTQAFISQSGDKFVGWERRTQSGTEYLLYTNQVLRKRS